MAACSCNPVPSNDKTSDKFYFALGSKVRFWIPLPPTWIEDESDHSEKSKPRCQSHDCNVDGMPLRHTVHKCCLDGKEQDVPCQHSPVDNFSADRISPANTSNKKGNLK